MLFLPLTQDWSVFSVFLSALFLVASKLVQPHRGKNTGWRARRRVFPAHTQAYSLGPGAGMLHQVRLRQCGWSPDARCHCSHATVCMQPLPGPHIWCTCQIWSLSSEHFPKLPSFWVLVLKKLEAPGDSIQAASQRQFYSVRLLEFSVHSSCNFHLSGEGEEIKFKKSLSLKTVLLWDVCQTSECWGWNCGHTPVTPATYHSANRSVKKSQQNPVFTGFFLLLPVTSRS